MAHKPHEVIGGCIVILVATAISFACCCGCMIGWPSRGTRSDFAKISPTAAPNIKPEKKIGAKAPGPETQQEKKPPPKILRMLDWETCRGVAAAQPWGKAIRIIPATVVDKGILKHVPYLSFQSEDYELNIYGDPQEPCGVELGIRNSLLKSAQAKKNCVQFIQEILGDAKDRFVVATLKPPADVQKRDGLTFEITPETAEDAYGGWWVSVYDESGLDRSRATPKELELITVRKETVPDVAKDAPKGNPVEWTSDDLRRARPAPVTAAAPSRVYVSGYTRKDGTYVHSYTRRR